MVGGVSKGGPAERAGVQTGDQVLAVGDAEITDVASLWRRFWEIGPAGSAVRLISRATPSASRSGLVTADRNAFLRAPRLH